MWLRWWHDEAVEASAEARKKLEASLRDAMPLTRTNLALGGASCLDILRGPRFYSKLGWVSCVLCGCIAALHTREGFSRFPFFSHLHKNFWLTPLAKNSQVARGRLTVRQRNKPGKAGKGQSQCKA